MLLLTLFLTLLSLIAAKKPHGPDITYYDICGNIYMSNIGDAGPLVANNLCIHVPGGYAIKANFLKGCVCTLYNTIGCSPDSSFTATADATYGDLTVADYEERMGLMQYKCEKKA